jgi:hypothetical protein
MLIYNSYIHKLAFNNIYCIYIEASTKKRIRVEFQQELKKINISVIYKFIKHYGTLLKNLKRKFIIEKTSKTITLIIKAYNFSVFILFYFFHFLFLD